MQPMPLVNVHDVVKLKGYCQSLFKKSGTVVGNTKEQPVNGEFIIPPSSLTALADNLVPLLDTDIVDREAVEYKEIEQAAVKVCSDEFHRDINSRRAVITNSGCFTYQHFYLREGILFHVVHMRGQDLRKFLADFWLIFRIQQLVAKYSVPEGYIIKSVQLRWNVDNFHVYLKPEEVPL